MPMRFVLPLLRHSYDGEREKQIEEGYRSLKINKRIIKGERV